MSKSSEAEKRLRNEKVGLQAVPASRPSESDIDRLEEYEQIAVRVSATLGEAPAGRVLLTAGAVDGDGASTVARNLAQVLTRDGTAKVLLVDANLRRPIQHDALDVARNRGLVEVLHGELPLDGATHEVVGGVTLLTAGRPIDNPLRVLDRPSLAELIDTLRERFDWIVVDGPPAAKHPEALLLSARADGVVLVLRAESTRVEVAAAARRQLEQNRARILGVVLNRRRYHLPAALYRRL